MFTGKTLDGTTVGISWPNAINGNVAYNYAYALSMNHIVLDAIVAHEIGHNLGANLTSMCNCDNFLTATIL